MLVVLAIVGIAAGAILLTAPDSRRALMGEAEHFAAGLARAKEEAVLTNRIVDVLVTPQAYAFGTVSRGLRRPLDERPFGRVAWSEETTVVLPGRAPQSRIIFDSTGNVTPAVVDLVRTEGYVRVSIDGAGSVRLDVAQR
jgi:general secretion pathway protein H